MPCLSSIPLTTTTITSTTVALTWSPVTGATGYQVEYKVNNPLITSYTLLPQQTTTSALVGSLTAGTEYLFRVNTFCGIGQSCYSATILKSTL